MEAIQACLAPQHCHESPYQSFRQSSLSLPHQSNKIFVSGGTRVLKCLFLSYFLFRLFSFIPFAMDTPILDSQVTGTQIQTWLRDYFGIPIKIESFNVQKIGEGQGFTSTIARVILKYSGTSQSKSVPKSVVFKSLSIAAMKSILEKLSGDSQSVEIEEMLDVFGPMHATECAIYKLFAKNPPLPMPLVYSCTECVPGKIGAILMEDLSERAAIVGNPIQTLNLEQMYQTAEALANLHAWCLTTEIDWKERLKFSDKVHHAATGLTDQMKSCFARTNVTYPDAFDKINPDKCIEYLQVGYYQHTASKHSEMMPDVIVHGDFYAPNLMFEKVGGKVGSKLVSVIDWALSHHGSAMEDFSRLITLSMETNTRREHTVDILKHYYTHLVKKAGSEKVQVSFQELLEIYDDHFVMAGIFYVLLLSWLQELYVNEEGQKGMEGRKILFDRCVAVYEDFLPIWFKICQKQDAEL